MKKLLLVMLVLVSSLFADEAYYSTSKITLYENGNLVGNNWYKGNMYNTYFECINNMAYDNENYVKKQYILQYFFHNGRKINYSNAECVTGTNLRRLMKQAQEVNKKLGN